MFLSTMIVDRGPLKQVLLLTMTAPRPIYCLPRQLAVCMLSLHFTLSSSFCLGGFFFHVLCFDTLRSSTEFSRLNCCFREATVTLPASQEVLEPCLFTLLSPSLNGTPANTMDRPHDLGLLLSSVILHTPQADCKSVNLRPQQRCQWSG